MMEELHLQTGRYLNKELAEWFGINPNSFNKCKERKLEELKNFANYHMEGKKVVIDKVLVPVYNKRGSDSYLRVKNKIDEVWDETGLDTCKRVSGEIYDILTNEDNDFNITPGTVEFYTRAGRNELYGKPFTNGGTLGRCSYLWCKKNDDGSYSMLTEEEQKIKQELQTKYFGDVSEKQIMVKAMIEAGEVSREEAWDILEEMTNMGTGNFMGFLKELQGAIGCQVVKGTLVDRNTVNFLEG